MSADLAQLAATLSDGALVRDPDVMAGYIHDQALDTPAGDPIAVVRARDTKDVQETLTWADLYRVPVVPRGAGTSLSGGATAVEGGVVLSLERLSAIRVDLTSHVAIAGAGAINADIKKAAAAHGLAYPPDPSSYEMCTIGGNVATNAGGLCCVKYGVTADYVLGLEVVLAGGRVMRLGGPRLKDKAGLSLTKLFVGSEGCLGVITEVTVRLVPQPAPFSTMVASFPSLSAATGAVLAITSTCQPSMLELMDRVTIRAVEQHTKMGLDAGAHAIVLARSDAPSPNASADVARMAEICSVNGATEAYCTDDPEEGEMFAAARRTALPAFEYSGNALILEDVGVKLESLPALIDGIERISAEMDTTIAVVAHAGDGNTHPLIVYDPSDANAAGRAQKTFHAVMQLTLELGGTITGEHGVGRLKKPWLPAYLGPDAMQLTRVIKDALDPNGILNPGCLL